MRKRKKKRSRMKGARGILMMKELTEDYKVRMKMLRMSF